MMKTTIFENKLPQYNNHIQFFFIHCRSTFKTLPSDGATANISPEIVIDKHVAGFIVNFKKKLGLLGSAQKYKFQ